MKGAEVLTSEAAESWLLKLLRLYEMSQNVYEEGLRCGVPKEVARLALTFGRYFTMRVTANLHNWLKFLSLRMDNDAQYEIRIYANTVGELIAERFPRTWELFSSSLQGKV